MPVVHSREELQAVIASLSERSFADGVLWDIPKARRREQAKNPQKQLRIGLEGDLKVRMATQINRFVERCGKQLGWDILIQLLEGLQDDELDALRDDENDFDDDQIQMSGLPDPVMALLHDLAYDTVSRSRLGYRNRARWILRSSNGVGIESR